MESSSEPWQELDAPSVAPRARAPPRVDVAHVDTSRLNDAFSKLLFFHTAQERADAQRRLVDLMSDILEAQNASAEVVRHTAHIWSLDDMDLLHLTFFFLLFASPRVLQRVAAMTDTARFCAFATWLLGVLHEKRATLSRDNGRMLAHAIRLKWSKLC
jgi:hypothetical protein